jgi:large subunit ribosomal protein L15|tara:strand:+ start:3104 stop:3556 length:453 start_codon:yes stop_codon:yes gene_type:complete
MNLSDLKPASGSVQKNAKRLGRGEGSGKGGTSARGHNGAKSRSGYSKKIGFEGGQMPLQRRVPKFGFTNINRKEYATINLDTIQGLIDDKKIINEVSFKNYIDLGIVGKNDLVKILGRGQIISSIKIEANKFSKTAKLSIEKAGGEVIVS